MSPGVDGLGIALLLRPRTLSEGQGLLVELGDATRRVSFPPMAAICPAMAITAPPVLKLGDLEDLGDLGERPRLSLRCGKLFFL